LGERLLCKQEVVGSIPSGSTSREETRPQICVFRVPSRFAAQGTLLSDIVKRRSIRAPLRPRSAAQARELELAGEDAVQKTARSKQSAAPDRPPSERSRKLVFLSVLVRGQWSEVRIGKFPIADY
jgi:hypothetical protein